jgi:hypothetical protein
LIRSRDCAESRSSAADAPIPVRHTLFRDVGSERLVRTAHMPSYRYATNTGTMPDRGKGEVEAARHDLSRFEKDGGMSGLQGRSRKGTAPAHNAGAG